MEAIFVKTSMCLWSVIDDLFFVVSDAVVKTTSVATNDNKFGFITTLCFQYSTSC